MSKKEVRATINKTNFAGLLSSAGHGLCIWPSPHNVICNILVIFGMTDRLLFLVCCLVTFFYLFAFIPVCLPHDCSHLLPACGSLMERRFS